MTDNTVIQFHEMAAAKPIVFDKKKCIGCNNCVEICQVDIFIPSQKNEKTPIVLFPGECWYCGSCVVVCPIEGAITLRHPLMNQVHWIEKSALKKKF